MDLRQDVSMQGTDRAIEDYRLLIGSDDPDDTSGQDERMNIVFGRSGADAIRGGSLDDALWGGASDDVLTSGSGMNYLAGGVGNDRLSGGVEDDTLRGDEGADVLDEGDGHGDVEGGAGDDTLTGGNGADAFVVDRESGNDVITDFIPGRGMFDHIALRNISPAELRFDETDAGTRISWANGESSVLLVGVSKSQLAQDDFMFTDDRQLLIPGGPDTDRLSAVRYAESEGVAVRAPTSTGMTQPSAAYSFDEFAVRFGSDQGDVFQATGDRDVFFGLGGEDRLFGGAGEDHLEGGADQDVLDGGDGQDMLKGGDGADTLFGGAMADGLMGEAGDDVIYGGVGHDMIEGGTGDDRLDGGDGADAFIVRPDSGNDIVLGGFDAGPGAFDHIAFEGILPEQVTVENQEGGVLVSWRTEAGDGSVLIEGLSLEQMSQDDFMFSSVEGGGFIDNPLISSSGTELLFSSPADTVVELQKDDLFVSGSRLRDGNNDGRITFGANSALDLGNGGTVSFTGADPVSGLRFLGELEEGGFAYADVATRPVGATEGTSADDRFSGDAGSQRFFFDTALDVGFGNDRIASFGMDDLLVTTTAIEDSDGNGRIDFGRNRVLDLSDGTEVQINGGSVRSLEFDGSVNMGGVEYFVYSRVGSVNAGVDDLFG